MGDQIAFGLFFLLRFGADREPVLWIDCDLYLCDLYLCDLYLCDLYLCDCFFLGLLLLQ